MKIRNKIAFALALVLIIPLASCTAGETDAPVTTTADSSLISQTDTTIAETENPYVLDVPDVRYDNYTLNIANDALNTTKYVNSKMTADTMNADAINDAIYARNSLLSEKFGIKIAEFQLNTNQIKTLLNSGEQIYDIIMIDLDNIPSVIAYATDLNSVNSIHLDMPWWDQNAVRDCSIKGKLYYTFSDAVIYGMDNTRAVYFNQDYAEQLQLGDLYQVVREGRWTIDTMNMMASQAYRDDGDGIRNSKDTYGFSVRAISLCEAMMVSAGISPLQIDSEGMPYLYCYEQQDNFISVFLDIMKKFKNDGVNYQSDADAVASFSNGLALFYMGVLKQGASVFRAGVVNYGILPLPKYDESQDKYLCLSPNGHSIIIPITNPDPERTGVILEAMSYYSSAYYSSSALMPSYFTITLQGKTARDSGSYECLQIIHDNIGYLLKYSGTTLITGLSGYFENGNTNVSSLLKQLQKVHESALSKFLADMK